LTLKGGRLTEEPLRALNRNLYEYRTCTDIKKVVRLTEAPLGALNRNLLEKDM
jgi:hypothetical protein